jgi:hypothetical protein
MDVIVWACSAAPARCTAASREEQYSTVITGLQLRVSDQKQTETPSAYYSFYTNLTSSLRWGFGRKTWFKCMM